MQVSFPHFSRKNQKEREKTFRLNKNPLLCKDEKEQIEAYITERLSELTDRKINLIELKKKISGQGENIDAENEVEKILGLVPRQREN